MAKTRKFESQVVETKDKDSITVSVDGDEVRLSSSWCGHSTTSLWEREELIEVLEGVVAFLRKEGAEK